MRSQLFPLDDNEIQWTTNEDLTANREHFQNVLARFLKEQTLIECLFKVLYKHTKPFF